MNNLKYRIENKYEFSPPISWIRVKNPSGYYEAAVGLEKISNKEYEYKISGYFAPILDGTYLLIRKDIAEVILKHVPEQVELKQVKITRESSGEYWTDYFEIKTLKNFDISEYDEIVCDDNMIFSLMINDIQQNIYLSKDLKNIIENELTCNEIEFVNGPIDMIGN